MTFLGKLLVFLNVILATALLSWSVSLYTNRVDWPAVEADGKKLSEWPPLHAKDAAAYNGLYADARESVRGAEVQLASRVKALSDQLDLAKAGATPPFFFELERVGLKPGQSPSDRFELTGDPARQTRVARKDGTSVPLLGLSVLQKQLQQAADATLGTEENGQESGKKGLAAIRKQLVVLDGQVAVFNGNIERFRVAIVQREDEKRYLDDNRVNSDAQLITLQKRNDQLVDRLKAFGVARPVVLAPVPATPTLAGPR